MFTLTNLLVAIHVVSAATLLLFVLLHSGRGGGLSDMLGGAGGTAAGSTVAERNLDRITVVSALMFAFTTLSLAIRLQ